MLLVWAVMYYSSLINLELNLQAGRGMDIGQLGQLYGGRWSAVFGKFILVALMYALVAAYFHGLISLSMRFFDLPPHWQPWMASLIFAAVFCVMSLPLHGLYQFNRILFLAMLAIGAVFIGGLCLGGLWHHVALRGGIFLPPPDWSPGHIFAVVPILFTSFGFQVIFHTLTEYCCRDRRVLQRAFFYGSLIPMCVYILWTGAILWVIHANDGAFYGAMARGGVEVGTLIEKLSRISSIPYVHGIVWIIAICSIVTSIIGVGLGLFDSLRPLFRESVSCKRPWITLLALFPPFLMAVRVPHAFPAFLGFSGIILSILAILLPLYLLRRGRFIDHSYPSVASAPLRCLCLIAGIVVIACEVVHLLR
jgi:tyrosine-specific transport protein